jgi:hypothetical protein
MATVLDHKISSLDYYSHLAAEFGVSRTLVKDTLYAWMYSGQEADRETILDVGRRLLSERGYTSKLNLGRQ